MKYDYYAYKVPKEKEVRVILDSDAKNEADDQFALVQALLTQKFDVVGMIAAHFGTRVSDSMEQSYAEMELLLDKMRFPKEGMVYHGCRQALDITGTPEESEGVKLIIEEAMKPDPRPLYIALMGPLTDIAAAYLLEPAIAGRITVIWIGGGPYPDGGEEFNLGNDIKAANTVFGSKLEVWQVPKNVYEMIPVSMAELEYRVRPCGEIGRYLFDQLMEHAFTPGPRKSPFRTGESWVLGDSPSIGLLLYEHRFEFDWVQAPRITQDMHYFNDPRNRPIRVYRRIDPRLILEDLYAKLALFAAREKEQEDSK